MYTRMRTLCVYRSYASFNPREFPTKIPSRMGINDGEYPDGHFMTLTESVSWWDFNKIFQTVTIMEFPDVDDSFPSVTKAYTTMGFPDMDDSIPSVTRAYTGIEFPRVDDFDSLESGGAAYVRLETANVDDYDSLVKQITVLEFPSDSELV